MSVPSPSSNGSEPLIARIWHGSTQIDRADEYAEYVERTGAQECRATPGNRGVYVLRRIHHGRAEFTFVSLWDSIEAIKRFAGADYEKAHYYPEDRDFLLELEPFVDHYDILSSPR
jgi:heme-degrading monooxygenase HmoA